MMDRCPCCKARLRNALSCPRCKADLTQVIHSEQSSRHWLDKAIHYWLERKTEQSMEALERSLCLKKLELAVAFRDYLIQKSTEDILDLLGKKQFIAAKKRLLEVSYLLPYSNLLKQLNIFTDYLAIREVGQVI